MPTKPQVMALFNRPCPASAADLTRTIRAAGYVDPGNAMERLIETIRLTPDFIDVTLPFVWREALRGFEALPDIPVLRAPGSVVLTQRECLCILANAFFCTFDRFSEDCPDANGLASINFDELYGGEGWGPVEVAKLQMLFNYFEQCRRRLAAGDALTRPIETTLRRARASSADDWRRCDAPLVAPVMHPLGESIDVAKDMLRVDFANASIGGAVLSYGCVQEEIMFAICPELIVSRLFCPAMSDDQAIVIVGAEQFSRPVGYGPSLRFDGPYTDPSTMREDGRLNSHIAAIDAVDFRWEEPERQYEPHFILRELTKCWTAFDAPKAPSSVATGNWGCGEFKGDATLKCVIQWLAASRAGKTMHYFPWNNEPIHRQFGPLASNLVQGSGTVGQVFAALVDGKLSEEVFSGLRGRLGT